MYRTKKYGLVSCKEENKILAELERDVEHKKKHKHKKRGKQHHGKQKIGHTQKQLLIDQSNQLNGLAFIINMRIDDLKDSNGTD